MPMGSLLVQYGDTLAIAEPCAFGYYLLMDRVGGHRPCAPDGEVSAPSA